jgi:transglutaminase-like putative cysteine protease
MRTTPVADLPDDALLFLVSSRYCDSDKLADFAWSQFGQLPGGARVVQAICDFVHAKIRFSYPDASPTRCASDSMHEGVGVCRDFAHLALCRCMNILARYCTGHLGDIGVPIDINPMDFSAWFEVFLAGRWYTMDRRQAFASAMSGRSDGGPPSSTRTELQRIQGTAFV